MPTEMGRRLPNFLHLGPGKSGSTWLHETLCLHPQVHLSPAKDLYFFSRYYDRGPDWYAEQFHGATSEHTVVGEVCPDYLAARSAADRIFETLGPPARLMVTLRDPADRAFSSYLYLQKHGLAAQTFRDTARANPELVEEGRYGTQLRQFRRYYPMDRLLVGVFDDFETDPQKFYDTITDWLDLDRQTLRPEQLTAKLPASKARYVPMAAAARRGADLLRRHDGANLVGRVKRSAWVQQALYTPLGDKRPTISPSDLSFIREELELEMIQVEEDFGMSLRSRWDWS